MSRIYLVLSTVVLALSVILEFSNGHLAGRNNAGHSKTRYEDDLMRIIEMNPNLSYIFGREGKQAGGKYRGDDPVRSSGQGHRFDNGHTGRTGHIPSGRNGHVTKHVLGHWFKKNQEHWLRKGEDSHVKSFRRDPGAGHRRRHRSDHLARARRQVSIRRGTDSRSTGLNLPRGITYTWTRDYGTGKSFDEAAFKSKDKNVIVMLSFDDTLKDANLTASATLYDFTGTSGLQESELCVSSSTPERVQVEVNRYPSTVLVKIMAIKTRKRPGPCFLLETSLTYDKVIAELETRNGSSVSTNAIVSLDGTASPVSYSEKQMILKKTPSFARQCRGRDIIRTRPRGFSPAPLDGQSKELKVLTMDAEVTITVPVDRDLDFGSTNQWSHTNLKMRRPGKGRNIWKAL